ncbi:MAG TPA: hypothetical protein V6C71_12120 [Coleofasciculaceae cyanobacterium]
MKVASTVLNGSVRERSLARPLTITALTTALKHPDLQEKVNIAREVANPKFTPAAIAQQLLAQHRSQKAQVQAEG